MNEGQKNSAARAYYSEFDGIINPNENMAEKVLALLAPVALLSVIFAIAAIVTGMNPVPLAAIAIILCLITLSYGTKDPARRGR